MQDASWSYAFELTVEFTRIMLGGVISAADIAMLQKGSPDQQEAVRAKIRTVQQLLSFPGGVPAMPGTAHTNDNAGCREGPMHICIYISVYTCKCMCMFMSMSMHINVCVCVCIEIHA